jgi:hypothetical protein
VSEELWYASLREKWKPARVRLLLVGESAPDPGSADRRFFYSDELDRRDNLFRGVVHALYDEKVRRKTTKSKNELLARLQAHGVYLIDLVPYPVDKLGAKQRREARQSSVSALVAEAQRLAPDGIIVCHTPTFLVASEPLRDAGLNLLHTEPLPFPLGNTRARFIAGARAALASQPGFQPPT